MVSPSFLAWKDIVFPGFSFTPSDHVAERAYHNERQFQRKISDTLENTFSDTAE